MRVVSLLPGPGGDIEFLAELPATQQYRYVSGVLHRIERDRTAEQHWLAELEQALLSLTPLEHFYPGRTIYRRCTAWRSVCQQCTGMATIAVGTGTGVAATRLANHDRPQFRHYFVLPDPGGSA